MMTTGQFGIQAAFLACGLAGLGLILIAVGITGTLPARSSLKWPAVDGEILTSEAAFDPFSGHRRARMRYQYVVDGKPYTGSRVAFNESSIFSVVSGGTAAPLFQQYTAGQVVSVYYDPADPGRSVLLPGSGPQSMIPIGIGGLFFILGLIAGIAAFL